MLKTLRRAVIVLPLAWTGAWLGYYAYTDTLRRAHIRSRNRELEGTLSQLDVNPKVPATDEEKAAIKRRFSSLKFAGRFWNPYVEWREQGAWEWAWWKLVLSTLNGKLFFFDGDLPAERPIPDLPIERPDFQLLFGKNASIQTPVQPLSDELMEYVPQQEMGCCGAKGPETVGHGVDHAHAFANGTANGHANGHANGNATGCPNCSGNAMVNGTTGTTGNAIVPHPPTSSGMPLHLPATVQRTQTGGNDIDITDKLTLTWLGQSTTYVTLDKLGILTDPALQDRTLPHVMAPQRLRPAPCTLDELKRVDLVLVSHNHYDHLDPEAVKELGDSCEWVVPSGAGQFLRELGVSRVTELDWWQETKHTLSRPGQEQTYTITAVPVMHWSARSPKDTNATLWSAFHVKTDGPGGKSFLHLGDTGYSPTLYEAVGRVLGPVDLAAIPIGSYEPRWHMHLQHTDPEGAVRMALNLSAKKSVGVHWGTWIMSDEKYNLPPVDLAKARARHGVSEEEFSVVPVGKTIVVD